MKKTKQIEQLVDAIKWLAGLASDFHRIRSEALSKLPDNEAVVDYIIFKMPIVQGTRNQMLLSQLGEMAPRTLDFKIIKQLLEDETIGDEPERG